MDVYHFYLSLFFLLLIGVKVQSQNGTLKMVQVLFRHGDRNPIWTYPNDPYNSESIFNQENHGQLTKNGKRQLYELGHYLRKRYDGFLSPVYNPLEIYVLSSDMDRTIMSAQLCLAGLYEPKNLSNNWNQTIDWNPVPLRTIPKIDDKILAFNKHCRKHAEITRKILNSTFVRKVTEDHRLFLDYLSENIGVKREKITINTASRIRDILLVEASHGYELPEWVTPHVQSELNILSGIDSYSWTLTLEAKRIRGGPILEHVLKLMEGVKYSKKFYMYSAHDSTLERLMGTLGIFDPIPPPYASALIIELYQSTEIGYYVEIFYRNETTVPPYPLHVPGCGIPCTLDTLIEITKQFIPADWEKECSNGNLQRNISPVTPVFLVLCTLMASLVCISIVIITQQKKSKKKRISKIYSKAGYETI